MREKVWRGKLASSHVFPHALMMSVSSLTGCACVHEGECVEGHAAFPHVLSHAHMLSTSSLTGCACSCEGGHVEGHTLTFPQVLPHTHTILSGLSPASLDQGWLGHLIWDKVCVTFTVRSSFLSYRIILGMGEFWEGLMQPLGICL